MRTIKMYCKKCGVQLTDVLHEVNSNALRFEDGVDMIQPDKFSILIDKCNNEKELVIANDEFYFKNHKDDGRFNGCCGSSGMDGMNKTCSNGHEVATEFSDCYMPHYIAVNIENVLIKDFSNPYEVKEIKL
ncbi:hypothetical protein NAT51_02675 [Flavobacterium amniphilum]|uniref:hypothetical protein n=1 Tax=Flavobacterium amniphilum TaxID=1834035 RepID=UPI00202A5C8D|nr:hypothetical protein [Flavobacterium amniphilum]MCL9804410.1 hypothetical protein [Flavobacterium amniphilum]